MAGSNPTVIIESEDSNFAGALAAALSGAFDVSVSRPQQDLVSPSLVDSGSVLSIIDSAEPLRVTRASRWSAVLALGPYDRDAMIACVEAGAWGYLDRDSTFGEIERAARSVLEGVAVIPPLMLGALLQRVVARRRTQTQVHEQLETLTRREVEVFSLIARGLDSEEVGRRLYISHATARTHLYRIFKKLGVHSRAELVALAAAGGLSTDIGEEG